MEFHFGFSQSIVEFELPGCATMNDLTSSKGDVSLTESSLGCPSMPFFNSRRRRRQQPQFPPKSIDLRQFETPHPNPLPSLRDSNQGRKNQLQTTPFIEESRNHLRSPLLLFKASLQQIRPSGSLSDARPDSADEPDTPPDPR